MMKLRYCKSKCRKFKGYKKGMQGYATKGGKCCTICEYQSTEIDDGRCRCCGNSYRSRPSRGLLIEVKRI